MGALSMMVVICSGEKKVEGGSKQDMQKFFSYFDRLVDVGAINRGVPTMFSAARTLSL